MLREVLSEAQRQGWIGPDLDKQLRHAGAFAHLLGEGPGVVFDLGSGGGLPALPCALARPAWSWVLVEAQQRRADHLASAVRRLGLGDRVEVLHARAEDVGRSRRGEADAVTARSFGPPALVAECAAPLLRVGGRLLVSEPPDGPDDRWPTDGLALVGLGPGVAHVVEGFGLVLLSQAAVCPERFPRRTSIARSSPLFPPEVSR